MDTANTITLEAGDVCYSVKEATVDIDEMIALLESAKEEGADRVVFLSGNYRGAQYLHAPRHYDWLEDL